MKPRVGSDLERGTERLAKGPGLTAISTRVDPRFPKPAIVAKERERRCVEGYLGVDGDGSRNGYVLPESGISRVRSFRSYARSFGFSLFRTFCSFVSFRLASFKGDGHRSVLVFCGRSTDDLWGKKNMRVKGTTHINRRTINSFGPRIFRAYLRRPLLGETRQQPL